MCLSEGRSPLFEVALFKLAQEVLYSFVLQNVEHFALYKDGRDAMADEHEYSMAYTIKILFRLEIDVHIIWWAEDGKEECSTCCCVAEACVSILTLTWSGL